MDRADRALVACQELVYFRRVSAIGSIRKLSDVFKFGELQLSRAIRRPTRYCQFLSPRSFRCQKTYIRERPKRRWLIVSRIRRNEYMSFHRIEQCTFCRLVSFGKALASIPKKERKRVQYSEAITSEPCLTGLKCHWDYITTWYEYSERPDQVGKCTIGDNSSQNVSAPLRIPLVRSKV